MASVFQALLSEGAAAVSALVVSSCQAHSRHQDMRICSSQDEGSTGQSGFFSQNHISSGDESKSQVCAQDHGLSMNGKLTATSNPGTQAGVKVCLQPRFPRRGPETVASGRSTTEARVLLSLSLDFGEGALEA